MIQLKNKDFCSPSTLAKLETCVSDEQKPDFQYLFHPFVIVANVIIQLNSIFLEFITLAHSVQSHPLPESSVSHAFLIFKT